jgi:hypothetical protein
VESSGRRRWKNHPRRIFRRIRQSFCIFHQSQKKQVIFLIHIPFCGQFQIHQNYLLKSETLSKTKIILFLS